MSEQPETQGAGGTEVASEPDSLDMGELKGDFGQSYSIGLIMAHPELKLIAYRSQGWTNARLDKRTGKIIKGKWTNSEWTPTRVAAAIQNTRWYKTTDGNIREADNAKAMDPASWNLRVERIAANIADSATKAGADIEGQDIRGVAERLLRENYLSTSGAGVEETVSQKLIDEYLTPYIKPGSDGSFKGEAAVTAAGLRDKARAYGVTFTDQWFVDAIQKLRSGRIAEADLDKQILDASRSRYAGLADKIDEKTSLTDLANPYIQMMADTLELNPATIKIDHPDIQKALQFVDPTSGQVRAKTLAEFNDDLRQKDEWINTRAGRSEMHTGLMLSLIHI